MEVSRWMPKDSRFSCVPRASARGLFIVVVLRLREDVTNVVSWRRKELLSKLAGVEAWKECAWVDTSVGQAIRNNQMRERHVPEWVIRRQNDQMEEPVLEEGWDEIVRYKR